MRADQLAVLVAAAVIGSAWVPTRAAAWCQMTSSMRQPTPTEPCVLARTGESVPLRWERRCTSISLSTMASSTLTEQEVRGVLDGAIQTWERVRCTGGATPGFDIELLPELNQCTRVSRFSNAGNVNSVIFVQDGWVEERMHDPQAFAITAVFYDRQSGEIIDADMEINEDRGPYGICPMLRCPPGQVDLRNVVTHELGHYLGLAHTPDDRLATMWAAADPQETIKRDLTNDDIAGLCSIYPPGSLPDECDPTPINGLNLACSAPSGGGCAIQPGARSGGLALLLAALALMAVLRRR